MKSPRFSDLFFFIYTAPTEFYTLSLHDALPISGIQSATSRQNTKDQVYAQNEMLAYQQKESTARVDKQASHFVHIPRSEERFSRNAETDLVCRLLLEKKKNQSRWCSSTATLAKHRWWR